ncbi:MAG TPA: cytochrome c5 family protein [Gammaproteobacteria bacterium]|nr:cytochrome c5 family protein [Gammaproteobacteria bacterium]
MKKFVMFASALALMAAMGTAQADGKATFTQACNACHGAGVAGAPKMGDAAAWKDRIAKGKATLYKHAIEGFKGKTGFMPPKGGWANLTDDQVKAAVDYMVAGSQ